MMNPVEILRKKRDGQRLNRLELEFLAAGIGEGTLPDYQIAAFAMAVFFKGLDSGELLDFTRAMAGKGLPAPQGPDAGKYVDKHSTGGVGDKLSLIILPLAAAAGLKIPKMSGRGLGFSGGTIDKLESIPGFQVSLDPQRFHQQIQELGFSIIGQTGDLAAADKRLYAIRDVTATVESIPLIASSIVSKKIASGNRNILFDVKVGRGAFMKDIEEGRALGRTLVSLVEGLGGKAMAVLTSMDTPLGHFVGNSLEVMEASETLQGRGPEDLKELSLTLAGGLLFIGGAVRSLQEGYSTAEGYLNDGSGYRLFREMVAYQGGNPEAVTDYSLLPRAARNMPATASADGYIQTLQSDQIGQISVLAGAGRLRKEDKLDYGAGVELLKKPGEAVRQGDVLAILHTSLPEEEASMLAHKLSQAYEIGSERPAVHPLILEVIS